VAKIINEHATDEAFGLGCYRRKIGNNLNYKNEQGQYVPTACNLIANIEQLDRQTHDIVGSSLKVSIGDDKQSLTYTIKSSDKSELWVTFTALDTNKIDPIEKDGTLTYKNVWEGIDVRLQPAAGKIKETIICNTKTPPKMVWSIKQSKQLTIKCNDNVAIWADRDGKEIFKTLAPWGEDSSKLALSLNGKQQLKASMFLDDKGNLVLELDQKDLDGAILPCEYDPTTVVVSGAGSISDAKLHALAPDKNYNNDRYLYLSNGFGGGVITPALFKLATASLPAGTISRFDAHLYASGSSYQLSAYVIAAGSTYTQASVCWNYRTYNTQRWAGGAGWTSADYDADASPPQLKAGMGPTFGTDPGWNVYPLKAAWVAPWQSGAHANNGFVILAANPGNLTFINSLESEYAPHFEIDWTEAAPASVGIGWTFKYI